eukprot:2395680-Rhodomonas_salina.2
MPAWARQNRREVLSSTEASANPCPSRKRKATVLFQRKSLGKDLSRTRSPSTTLHDHRKREIEH